MTAWLQLFYRLFSFGRGIFSFLLFLLLSYGILKSSIKEKMAIADFAVSTFLYPAQYITNTVLNWERLEKENAKLKIENAQLRLGHDLLRQAIAREQRLSVLENYKTEWLDTILISEIVAKNPGRLQTSFLVNNGSGDHLEPGMPVFTSKGLVGKISKVYLRHAVVQLLFDPQFKVSVILSPSRVAGVLEAPDSRKLVVDLPAHAKVSIGDTLVTSGLGGVFPKGLLVGQVNRILAGELGVLKRVEIKPFQDPMETEEILILRKTSDWIVREFAQ